MSVNYGRFSGNPKTEWLTNPGSADREMKLLEDFWYIDPDGKKWAAPKGSVIDGASIPRPLWSTVGSPFTDDYRNASIVHDVACQKIDKFAPGADEKRKEADRMFFYACLAGGCSQKQAEILYIGVRIGIWAFRAGNWIPSNWKDLLFRFSTKRSPEENALLKKFRDLVSKESKKAGKWSFDDLQFMVDRSLE